MTSTAGNQAAGGQVTDWARLLSELRDQVKGWAESQKWSVDIIDNQLSEEGLGSYKADILRILAPKGELRLEPIGKRVIGAEGRVDMTAWPSMNRVKLVRRDSTWQIFTDSNVQWPKDWNKDTFVDLAQNLVAST